jgi:hypothetical protein
MKSKYYLLLVLTFAVILFYSFFSIKQTDIQAKPINTKETTQINVAARDEWVPMSQTNATILAARDEWVPMSQTNATILAARDEWVPISQTMSTALVAKDDWVPMSIQGNALT